MRTDTIIIGGGLSGLALAYSLHQQGKDFMLLEARPRFGGRILSSKAKSGARYDLGPAWFWPGQPRILKLLNHLGIGYFEQHAKGNLVFQDRSGTIRRDINMATMEGAYRIEGGIQSLTDALVKKLPEKNLLLNSPVTLIEADKDGVCIASADKKISANRVVICVPPRVVAQNISFSPPLMEQLVGEMANTPTWMAAHAKFFAVYDRPFWREEGLSGDAISHVGPMVELHDASAHNSGTGSPDTQTNEGAIFGFLGVPANSRKDISSEEIIQACHDQLVALFGASAADPIDMFYQDWAQERFTSTIDDISSPLSHPRYSTLKAFDEVWGSRLIFSGTETAPQFGGFLEGALEAAENALTKLGK